MLKITSEILSSVVLCLLLLLVPGGFSFASDHDVTDQVNVYCGLAPALQLTCEDVNFGSWRVPRGLRQGGATTIQLQLPDDLSLFNRIANTLLSYLQDLVPDNARIANVVAPEYSVCVLTGSSLVEGSEVSMTLTNNNNIPLKGSSVHGLDAAGKVPSELQADLGIVQITSTIDKNGSATWRISGDFTIPDNLDLENYGGFSSIAGATAVYTHN